MNMELNDPELKNMSLIFVILGKNGCGKSSALRRIRNECGDTSKYFIKYISPERGGNLQSEAHIDQETRNISSVENNRYSNFVPTFRQTTMALFRSLKELIQEKIELDPNTRSSPFKFDNIFEQINNLLDRVKLVRNFNTLFDIKNKLNDSSQLSQNLSSGEKELITLSIEILFFIYQVELPENQTKNKILLLDEPDVHLHPDLQHRLIEFLVEVIKDKNIKVMIATHSTPILGALSQYKAFVSFRKKKDEMSDFISIDKTLQDILPIFGAHPLTNIFNQKPIMLIEGEDDERIWQQVVRSSNGRIKLWPCVAGNKEKLEEYENLASKIMDSIYDKATAYSLRDRDNDKYEIEDKPNIICFRLNCYAAENLILTDEVLESLNTNWKKLQDDISEWLKLYVNNQYSSEKTEKERYEEVNNFAKNFDRQNFKIKKSRNLILALADKDCEKPWEVIVGQTIAKLNSSSKKSEGSLRHFLGEKLINTLKICM